MSANPSDDNRSDDVVNFPVPRKYLSAVIQALARIIEADQKEGESKTMSPVAPAVSFTPAVPWPTSGQEGPRVPIDWNEESLTTLRKWLNNQAALTLLDMVAERPNERVYVEEVARKVGCTHGQVGAGLGVLTKTIKKMYNIKHNQFNWPAPFNWDAEKQLAYYTMEEDVADAWKATAAYNSTPSQRDMMCKLVAQFGLDEATIVKEYAAAEMRGEVVRKSNTHNISSEVYARALWKDGMGKGWLNT
jgi:hypothetical protein